MGFKLLPPFLNNFIVRYQKNDWVGKYFFYQQTKHIFKNYGIKHQISKQPFIVPYDQWCFWLEHSPDNYYLDEFLPFFHFINEKLSDFTFYDLGADIGVVSALVNKHCPNLREIHAFEPNPKSYQLLAENLNVIPKRSFTNNKAISNFVGKVAFSFDEQSGSDHEGHIDVSGGYSVPVTSLDEYCCHNKVKYDEVVLKIDVEGQEKQAFEGAKNIITNSSKVIVLLELHPEVLELHDQTPEILFKTAEAIRPFQWYVPKFQNGNVNRNKPFFKQYKKQQYDVIGFAKYQ